MTTGWILYSEQNWKQWQNVLVKTAGLTQYKHGYDGYALFTELVWPNLPNVGDAVGFFIDVPTGGATGYTFTLKIDASY